MGVRSDNEANELAAAPGVNVADSPTEPLLRGKVDGDSYDRVRLLANGTLQTGDGTTAPIASGTSVRVVDEAIYMPTYTGADPTGVADSTAAFTAALASIPQTGSTRGGKIKLGLGVKYRIDGTLDLRQLENVTIEGPGGMPRSYSPALLSFTKADSSSLIKLGSCNSVRFDGFRIETTNSAFSGRIIDTAAAVLADSQMIELNRMGFRAAGTSAILVALLHSVGAKISHCLFSGGAVGIEGARDPAGTGNPSSGYAIGVTIDEECQFGSIAELCIKNPDYVWKILGNIFSPSGTGLANAIGNDGTYKIGHAVDIIGNYMGDASSGTYVRIGARGLHIAGNYIDGHSAAVGIRLEQPTYGGEIVANTINCATGIDCGSGGLPHQGVRVAANDLVLCTTPIVNHDIVNADVDVRQNYGVTDRAARAIEASLGLTVAGGSGSGGLSITTTGDLRLGVNREIRAQYLADKDGTQSSVDSGVYAGEAVTARSMVTTRTPLNARAPSGLSVDLQRLMVNAVVLYKVTKEGASVTGSSVTGSRPSAATVGVAAQWYDTTLSKPIWSDGTVWRDAAGTAV